MAEVGTGNSDRLRRWLPVAGGLVVGLACAVALLAGSARAAPPAGFGNEGEKPLLVPGAFRLQASNGYSLVVIAEPPRNGSPSEVLILVSGKQGGVRYTAPATVTETSIEAKLGALGEISVSFQRSGQATTSHSRCIKKPVSFDSGHWEGTIEFHGEEGYTDAAATSAPGNIDFLLEGLCGFSIGGGSSPHALGAELRLRNPALGPELWVIKRRPAARALIEATDRESVNGISIARSTAARIPAGGFTYDKRLRTATLRPRGRSSPAARATTVARRPASAGAAT